MLFLEIGLRYLQLKKGGRGISLISFVSMIGMALGVLALTVVVSVMNGFDKELKRRILGVVPHVVAQGQLSADKLNLDGLIEDKNVIVSSPFLEIQGMLVSNSGSELTTIYGVIPGMESEMSIVSQNMVQGDIEGLAPHSREIILGRSLAFHLGLLPGDKLTLVVPKTSHGGRSLKPNLFTVYVRGTFELGSELDYGLSMMHLEDVKMMSTLAANTRYKLDNIFNAPQLAKNIRQGYKRDVSSWVEDYGDFFQTVRMEKTMMFILMSVIIAIAAFNIISSLSILVIDKKNDIAVLRTMGANSRQIMTIFVMQGLLIGLIGCLLGLALGLPLAFNITEVVGFFEDLFNSRVLSGTYFDRVPSDVRVADIVVISLVSITITFMATIRPALKAVRLKPAVILRSE